MAEQNNTASEDTNVDEQAANEANAKAAKERAYNEAAEAAKEQAANEAAYEAAKQEQQREMIRHQEREDARRAEASDKQADVSEKPESNDFVMDEDGNPVYIGIVENKFYGVTHPEPEARDWIVSPNLPAERSVPVYNTIEHAPSDTPNDGL